MNHLKIWAFDITIMVVLLIDYWFEDESFEDWTFDIKNLGVFALRFNRCWGGDCDVIAPIDTNLRIIWPTTLCKILSICLARSGLICGSVQLWGFFYKVSKLAQKGIPSSLSVVWLVHLVLRGRELEFERGEGDAFIYQIHHKKSEIYGDLEPFQPCWLPPLISSSSYWSVCSSPPVVLPHKGFPRKSWCLLPI
jgi:hypothetical protein